MSRFTRGLGAAVRGLPIALTNGAVRRTYLELAAALFLLTCVLYFAAGWAVYELTGGGAELTHQRLVLRGIGWLIVLLVAPVMALFIVHVLVPLFSERVFLAAMDVVDPELASELRGARGLSMAATVGVSLRRFARYLLLTACVLALTLIPVFGSLLGPPLQLLLSSRTLGGELLDPYLARRGLRYAEQARYLRANRPEVIGFALPYVAVLAVPFVGALLFSLAQAAAAVLVADVLRQRDENAG